MMADCPRCGGNNPDQARYCMLCGLQLPESGDGKGFRKTVTIVFCDLVGSTALGEHLDPEALSEVLRTYFEAMKKVVEHHGGTVAKFIGDAVMGVFGVPVTHEDDALRAVRAAEEMRAELVRLNEEFDRRWGVRLETRTGLSTGSVAGVGVTPDENFISGDAGNVAARLQQLAAGNEVLLADPTYRLVKHSVSAEPLRPLSLKGKGVPVSAWRLNAVSGPANLLRDAPGSPIVGRREELDALEHALAAAISDSSWRLATLLGEPGMGKSRLVEEFAESSIGRATVLRGRASSYAWAGALAAFAQVVHQALAIDEKLSPAIAVDKIQSLMGNEEGGVAERILSLLALSQSSFPPEESAWAIRKLLDKVAASRPLVVILEDVHGGGQQLLDLVEELVGAGGRRPFLMIATARYDLLELRPSWTADHEIIELPALPATACRELVGNLLSGARLQAGVEERVLHAAQGNPLFIEHIISMWFEEHLLIRTGETWSLAAEAEESVVPPSISALLSARLENLDAVERVVIGAASVIGETFSRPALLQLCVDSSQRELDEALSNLHRKRLIHPLEGNDLGTREFMFVHAMVCDTSYDSMLKRTRARYHERFAEWLEQVADPSKGPKQPASLNRPEPRPDGGINHFQTIGYHLDRACRYLRELGHWDEHARGLTERAAHHLLAAANGALGAGDFEQGNSLFDRVRHLIGLLYRVSEPDLVADVGAVANRLGRWEASIRLLRPYVATHDHAGVLKHLGVALTKLHRVDPSRSDYREGQAYLERAAGPPHLDVDAASALAGSWKGIDDDKAHRLYERALNLDPLDPYPLGNFLEEEIRTSRNLGPVHARRAAIALALERRRRQANAGDNLPWAFYDQGKFQALLGAPYEALCAYAKAVQLSSALFMIDSALTSVAKLEAAADEIPGLDWIRRLLMLSKSMITPNEAIGVSIHDLASLGCESPEPPIVMVVGGTSMQTERRMRSYESVVTRCFADFRGTVISGGTTAGVSGIIASLRGDEESPYTIGYVPDALPEHALGEESAGYRDIRRTPGADFSPLEPLQAWTDVLSAGIDPATVKVLGVGGGRIAAAEYRIALALGAWVGVVEGSGGAVADILVDRDWVASRRLVRLNEKDRTPARFISANNVDSLA